MRAQHAGLSGGSRDPGAGGDRQCKEGWCVVGPRYTLKLDRFLGGRDNGYRVYDINNLVFLY